MSDLCFVFFTHLRLSFAYRHPAASSLLPSSDWAKEEFNPALSQPTKGKMIGLTEARRFTRVKAVEIITLDQQVCAVSKSQQTQACRSDNSAGERLGNDEHGDDSGADGDVKRSRTPLLLKFR